MVKRQVSCMLDGDTFVGSYRVFDHGQIPSVSVQFERQALSARLDNMPEERVARALLSQLVRAKVSGERHTGLAA